MLNIFSPNFCSIFVENKYFSQIQQSKQPDATDHGFYLISVLSRRGQLKVSSDLRWGLSHSPRLTQLWCPHSPMGWEELWPVERRGARAIHMRMRTPSAGHVSRGHVSARDHVSLPSRVQQGQSAWQGSLRPSTPGPYTCLKWKFSF